MEQHARRLLHRIALLLAAVATASLLHIAHNSSANCFSSSTATSIFAAAAAAGNFTISRSAFPSSSCSAASRRVISPESRLASLRSTSAWKHRVGAFSDALHPFLDRSIFTNDSRVLCVSAGAGQELDAFASLGVADITAVDVADFPPLVSRADPHNLPFFDGSFDVVFSAGLSAALFPKRFAAEMERMVGLGGVLIAAVEKVWGLDTILSLFRDSLVLEVQEFVLDAVAMRLIVMRKSPKNVPP